MKIALVHELLTSNEGGAEYVFKKITEVFPDAPVYCWVYDKEGIDSFWQSKDVRPSLVQKLPWGVSKYQWYLMLMPAATDHLDLRDYDLVISSSSNLIKGVITQPNSLHICYCHTPPRYLWTETQDYIRDLRQPSFVKKILPHVLPLLRTYDYNAAQRVNFFIANSKNVVNRINKFYQRKSEVIYPPVDLSQCHISNQIENFFLAGGRIMAYKRFDLIVQAFNRMNIPLKVFGSGPELEPLKKIAKFNIEFLGKISDKEKFELYSRCLAYIHPQEEDFGITPIEAMACGRPVIAYGKGGVLESVINNVTGKFFDEQTWESLGEAIIRFKPEDYDSQKIREHAMLFSEENFKNEIKKYVERAWQDFQSKSQALSTKSQTNSNV